MSGRSPSGRCFRLTAENELASAAEQVQQITQAHVHAGISPHGEAPEISGALPVGRAAVFDLIQRMEVFRIVRLHAHRAADVLQRRYLIAQTVVGQGAEVVPPGIALLGILQCVQRLLIAAEPDVLVSGLLIGIPRLAAVALLTVAAEGIVIASVAACIAIAAGTAVWPGLGCLLGMLATLLGIVYFLHFPGRFRVARIPVRVVFLCQLTVGPLDLLGGGIGTDPKNLVRITHGAPPSLSVFLRN